MLRFCAAVLLLMTAVPAAAETAYVTDMLHLGIHEAQDTSDQAFDTLTSGTELEVLERVPNYARVETPDGRTGWVKSAYLVADRPARLRVAELEARIAELETALADAEQARRTAEREAAEIREQHAASVSSAAAVKDTLAELKSENETYERRLDAYRGAVPGAWAAGALGVSLVAGFLGGLWWLDARIRRRHGGFRVY